jgi:hypothetical protein
MARSTLIRMSRRGTITLPPDLRKGLDEDTVFEPTVREDGTIELRPRAMVPASQKWFWSARWQAMEREADDDIRKGRIQRFESGEEFLNHLERLASDDE